MNQRVLGLVGSEAVLVDRDRPGSWQGADRRFDLARDRARTAGGHSGADRRRPRVRAPGRGNGAGRCAGLAIGGVTTYLWCGSVRPFWKSVADGHRRLRRGLRQSAGARARRSCSALLLVRPALVRLASAGLGAAPMLPQVIRRAGRRVGAGDGRWRRSDAALRRAHAPFRVAGVSARQALRRRGLGADRDRRDELAASAPALAGRRRHQPRSCRRRMRSGP